jgi:hypothetical protein
VVNHNFEYPHWDMKYVMDKCRFFGGFREMRGQVTVKAHNGAGIHASDIYSCGPGNSPGSWSLNDSVSFVVRP